MLRRKFLMILLSTITAVGVVTAIPQSANAALSCTLSYDAKGGASVPSKTTTCGVKITMPSTTKSGATFLGWDTSSAASKVVYSVGTLVANNDQKLYAVWRYTVTFKANGHGTAPGPIQVTNGNKASLPSIANVVGYRFQGWCGGPLGQTCLTVVPNPYTVSSNVTLSAKWAPATCTTSFNTMGGSAVGAKTLPCGTTITAPSATKSGAKFLGWDTSSVASTVRVSSGSYYGTWSTATLYAVWQYTITYKANGAGVPGAPKDPASQQGTYGNTVTLKTMSVTGATFKGWCVGQAACLSPVKTLKVTGNVTLYAQWSWGTCTVNFNPMGGTAVTKKTQACGASFTVPSTSKSGATFMGWDIYPAASAVQVKAGSVFAPKAGMTFYAVWKYTVSFNANGHGGAPAPAAQQIYNGLKTVLPRMADYGDYTFRGWCAGAPTCGSLASDPYPVSGNVTMYAQWTWVGTYADSVSLSQGTLSLSFGSAATLTATMLPSWVSNKNITWSSSDTRIVTIYTTGTGATATITAGKTPGCATVTATSGDGKKWAVAYVGVSNRSSFVDDMICGSDVSMINGGSTVRVSFTAIRSLDQTPLKIKVCEVTFNGDGVCIAERNVRGTQSTAVGPRVETIDVPKAPIGWRVVLSAIDGSGAKTKYVVTTPYTVVSTGQPLPQNYLKGVTRGELFTAWAGLDLAVTVISCAYEVCDREDDLVGIFMSSAGYVMEHSDWVASQVQCDLLEDEQWTVTITESVVPNDGGVNVLVITSVQSGSKGCNPQYSQTLY